jgi:hypothetical protein
MEELCQRLLTQAAEVGGRWASRPPGGWWEGAPQSWRGVIHHIWREGSKERRESEQGDLREHMCMRPKDLSRRKGDTQYR